MTIPSSSRPVAPISASNEPRQQFPCFWHTGLCQASKSCPPLYNFRSGMQKPRYALVAYVKSPAGEFVENLRRELHPDLPQIPAHLTILPPRPMQGSEGAALQILERICGEEEPFQVTLGAVETFIPLTPTVFIRIEADASRMSELHCK